MIQCTSRAAVRFFLLLAVALLSVEYTIADSPKVVQFGPTQWKGGEYPPFTPQLRGTRRAFVKSSVLAGIDFNSAEAVKQCSNPHNVKLDYAVSEVPVGEEPDGEKVSRGVLRAQGTGDDPFFSLPPLTLTPDAKLSGELVIRLRIRAAHDNGQFFWSEHDKPGYDSSREASVALVGDGKWRDYYIKINPQGELTRLRYDTGATGSCEIASIELCRLEYAPVELIGTESEPGKVLLHLRNTADTKRTGRVETFREGGDRVDSFELEPMESKTIAVPLDDVQAKPFEIGTILIRDAETPQLPLAVTFARSNPEADGSWRTLHGDGADYQFAEDGSGARIVLGDMIIGTIYPLVSMEHPEAPIVPDSTGGDKPRAVVISENARLSGLALKPDSSSDKDSLSFSFSGKNSQGNQVAGQVRFAIRDGNLGFQVKSTVPVHGPIFRPLGNMTQAVFPGVEYLEKGEYSSSTADIDTKETLRFAPSTYWITNPFMTVTTGEASFTLLYDDPELQPVFASPNFLDDALREHRMNTYGMVQSGTIRVRPAESLEDAILWGVKTRQLPDLPKRPRSQKEQDAIIMAAFNDSVLKTDDGWRHATLPSDAKIPFRKIYGSDFISTIWEITGELPKTPRVDVGGGHMENAACFLLTGKADQIVHRINSGTKALIAAQRPDGSYRYSGKFTRCHWSDTASGHCANNVFRLLMNWRESGNADALAAGLKGLEFINGLKTPRGAQVWELSLHTPDIMASARCAMANTFAYEATGEREYLEQARRWAITGLPFVYLRGTTLPGVDDPIMPYAGIAVFGATKWHSPNWMGRPVQWCGLDYARALIYLAPYEDSLDWKKIAEGMIISGEIQQYPDGPCIGLLPDSVEVKTQTRYPYDINPTALHYLRRLIEGKATAVNPVFDKKGRHVLSPFKAEIVGDEVVIQGKAGTQYEIIVNGSQIHKIDSKGVDRITLTPSNAEL